ncbi:MAG: UDP-N-acetylmuramoyl-L-alanine--D-glutamate ligase, partial [Firmicutes bacterium]|nr:UDP-N-acetylmuramoyl-L-alanine--D-glutamate ligase [Bacillota bacterium]
MSMKETYSEKKVLVIGMGRSGLAAADALIKCGAKVSIQDSKKDCLTNEWKKKFEVAGVKFFLGGVPADMSAFDVLVVSPGVPTKLDFIQDGIKGGAKLIGELELAYEIGKGNYIAITGTNGKTTTTTLVGEIFKASGRKTDVVGNIGLAVATKALDATDDEWLVTETSSFQLDTIDEFRPKVAAILNLAPDHLDRHGSYENYIAAKARVFENQTEEDYVVLNGDDEEVMKLAETAASKVVLFSRKEEPDLGA